MAARVVTLDLESLLGAPVVAAVAVAYRGGAAVPAPLTNGYFLDCLVQVTGVVDAGALHQHAHETPPGTARLHNGEGGHIHEIYGVPRYDAPLDAEQAAAPRMATVTLDVGAALNARVDRARFYGMDDGRAFIEAEIDSPVPDASAVHAIVYDAIEDHPPALRAFVERTSAEPGGQSRRQSAGDGPPEWVGK